MDIIEDKSFDAERAFYGSRGITIRRCRIDGPADGESAFKESADVVAEDCLFNLRYPFWHDRGVAIRRCRMTDKCRAALWYSENIAVSDTEMHGIKALRECRGAEIVRCDIVSPEFGWSSKDVRMRDTRAESEYFFLRAENLTLVNVDFSGKYAFQYIENATFDGCRLTAKDAFWHAKNVTVKNCTIDGEYLGWYSDDLTLENCRITGTQPLCYCRNLRLVNCELHGADLAFEKSDVTAEITAPVISVKNPYSGTITAPAIGQIIRDDPAARAAITITGAGGEHVGDVHPVAVTG